MNNLNQIYLLGNLTRDPEIKYTSEGIAIAELGIAVNKRWKDSNGEDMEAVDFLNVTAWNSLAENCVNTLKRGDRVLISGHLNLRSWENKEGKKFNIININADVISASLEFCNIKITEKTGKKAKKETKKDPANNMKEENFSFEN